MIILMELYGLMVEVLIESDWNLNLYIHTICSTSFYVLIESDWNLNQETVSNSNGTDLSINRIRLEFKSEQYTVWQQHSYTY